jgi:hypothetical protein
MESSWHNICTVPLYAEVMMSKLSPHANRRCAQRSVSDEHIELALAWGRPIQQPDGRVAWHLGHREASHAHQTGVRIPGKAIDLAVVVAQDGTVVTVVRSGDRHRLTTHGRLTRPRHHAGGAR